MKLEDLAESIIRHVLLFTDDNFVLGDCEQLSKRFYNLVQCKFVWKLKQKRLNRQIYWLTQVADHMPARCEDTNQDTDYVIQICKFSEEKQICVITSHIFSNYSTVFNTYGYIYWNTKYLKVSKMLLEKHSCDEECIYYFLDTSEYSLFERRMKQENRTEPYIDDQQLLSSPNYIQYMRQLMKIDEDFFLWNLKRTMLIEYLSKK